MVSTYQTLVNHIPVQILNFNNVLKVVHHINSILVCLCLYITRWSINSILSGYSMLHVTVRKHERIGVRVRTHETNDPPKILLASFHCVNVNAVLSVWWNFAPSERFFTFADIHRDTKAKKHANRWSVDG